MSLDEMILGPELPLTDPRRPAAPDPEVASLVEQLRRVFAILTRSHHSRSCALALAQLLEEFERDPDHHARLALLSLCGLVHQLGADALIGAIRGALE
jgi:hypothetical protein